MSGSVAGRRTVVVADVGTVVGEACAHAFAAEGDDLLLVDPGPGVATELAARLDGSGSAHGLECDGSPRALEALCDYIASSSGKVDALVLYLSRLHRVDALEATEKQWREALEKNVLAPILYTQALLPFVRVAPRGAVVYFGSVDGTFGNPQLAPYSVAKGALTPLTHVMADACAPDGIRVNQVRIAGIAHDPASPPPAAMASGIAANTPLCRFGVPPEYAAAAVFLCSEGAGYITGSEVTVDGGRTSLTPGTRAVPA